MAMVLLPPMPGIITPGGKIVLTRRFVAGIAMNRKFWDVPQTVVLEPGPPMTGVFDVEEYDPASLPFRVEVRSYQDPGLADILGRHEIALATVGYRQNRISALCRSTGTACVYVAEFSLKTNIQIMKTGTKNPLLRARRLYWVLNQERCHRKAVRLADGIQCNGVPCFDNYAPSSKNPLLFFDTRVTNEMMVTPEELDRREAYLKQGQPLRLLYSGQFSRTKGADHLAAVADELRKLGVAFRLTLCGQGPLEPQIRSEVDRLGLSGHVTLAGVLDFKTQLNPLTRTGVDLFLCCHIQGDPAGTYTDVAACGVPMVGYDNEALVGMDRHSHSNRVVPMNRPDRVAAAIAGLDADRASLMALGRKALAFAQEHTFERTFERRIDHLKECLEQSRARKSARPLAKIP